MPITAQPDLCGIHHAIQKGGHITADGDVDLKVKGTGILANGGGSTVVVKGGGTVSIENNDDAAHYALAAESGKIDFNVDEDEIEAGTKKVTIEGNVGVLNGAVNLVRTAEIQPDIPRAGDRRFPVEGSGR